MTISYENTPDDAIAVNVHRVSKALANQDKKRRPLAIKLGIFSALLASLSVILSILTRHIQPATLLLPLLSVFMLVLLSLIYNPRSYRALFQMQRKELTRNGALRGDTGLRQVSVQPEGLIAIQPGVTELLLRWNAVEQVEVGESHLFVTWAAQQALAIPRRTFADVGQENAFLSLIEQYRARVSPAPPVAVTTTVDVSPALRQTDETPWYRSRDGVDVETTA